MKKIFGIPVTLLVLGLLVLGTATAVLVKYYSNTVTHTVDVSSPLEMTGDTALSISIFGGENIYYEITTKNLANLSLESYPITQVTGPAVWDGTEITEVWLEDPNGLWNVTSMVYIIKDDLSLIPFSNAGILNTTTLKLYFDNTATGTLHPYDRPIGFDEWNYITITTNSAIMPGEYIINSCQLFDPSGTCV